MRKLLFFIFCFISTFAFSKEESDTTKHPIKVSGEVSLNSNGIAPIPAFAFGKPTIMGNLNLKKNRFTYNPQLSYGLNFKPWIIDNWFRYRWVDKPRFEMRTSLNFSMFFSEYDTPDGEVWQGQRWIAFELAGMYKFSPTASLSLMAWYDKGVESGTITGWFFNLVADKTDIPIGKHLLMAVNVQTFYINYTDNNDGFFISPKIAFSIRRLPVSIFSQIIQPIITNMDPSPDFQWNIGLGYAF